MPSENFCRSITRLLIALEKVHLLSSQLFLIVSLINVHCLRSRLRMPLLRVYLLSTRLLIPLKSFGLSYTRFLIPVEKARLLFPRLLIPIEQIFLLSTRLLIPSGKPFLLLQRLLILSADNALSFLYSASQHPIPEGEQIRVTFMTSPRRLAICVAHVLLWTPVVTFSILPLKIQPVAKMAMLLLVPKLCNACPGLADV
jgi:hypothetical protein